MMVYVLTQQPGGGRPMTCGIFSTLEKAENAKKRFESEIPYLIFDIEKWEVE